MKRTILVQLTKICLIGWHDGSGPVLFFIELVHVRNRQETSPGYSEGVQLMRAVKLK